jgi:hypothetical protein
MKERRFPPSWSVDDPDTKLGQDCYVVRDANGHPIAYFYFEDEPASSAGEMRQTSSLICPCISSFPSLFRLQRWTEF